MGTVKLDNVTKMYGKDVAVKNLSLEIREEEFFVLVGPSGAGKTTTLKTVAGLVTPSEGRVYIDGKLSNLVKPADRNVSMTFESYALYPHFSVYDNIANPLRSPKYKKSEDEVDKEVKRIANMLEIGHLLDRRPGELSGGQKQRVSLGRAIVRRPAVFLLDEPLSHVDAKVRHRMRVELNRIQRELNTTTIYVTHDYVEGLSLGDRVGVLKDGQIEQVDVPKTVYHKPMNEFVAKHVGFPEVNLIGTSVRSHDGEMTLVADDIPSMQFVLTREQAALVKEKTGGGRVRVGFRPQAVEIVPDGKGTFQGTVYAFNPFVTYGVLILEVEGTRFRVLTQSNRHFKVDETLSVKINSKDIYLFDEQTTTNLEYR
ncbi:MAG: ABC transporter ATP-binding protein [Spirochaeta sp.]|jgi:multiple sugar transport system ATP-binding protein|nr:ABC transporter ATP-binding protein [Spirochaeta sp.]